MLLDIYGALYDFFTAVLYDDAVVNMFAKGMVKQLLVEWHWDPDSK